MGPRFVTSTLDLLAPAVNELPAGVPVVVVTRVEGMDTADEQVARGSSARLMGFDDWESFEPLDGGKGGASLAWKDSRAYVVKTYPTDDGTAGARERAALRALDGAAGAPGLLAESDDPPCVVMVHLDGTGSLADALLGTDGPLARQALLAWAEALATLHAVGTPSTRATFTEALAQRSPMLRARSLADDFAAAAEMYAEKLAELGLPPHEQALDELRALPSRLDDPRHEVLSPADTCPDNNVITPERMHLIDFEHAELRHRAWDVAYLRAPWPSCWCAWRIPEDAGEAAIAAYRETASGTASQPEFLADVEVATLGWQAMTPAWFLGGALAGDDRDVAPRRPSRRAFVLHRLAAVAANDAFPALAAMAADLCAELRARWGEVPLELAPAFRC